MHNTDHPECMGEPFGTPGLAVPVFLLLHTERRLFHLMITNAPDVSVADSSVGGIVADVIEASLGIFPDALAVAGIELNRVAVAVEIRAIAGQCPPAFLVNRHGAIRITTTPAPRASAGALAPEYVPRH